MFVIDCNKNKEVPHYQVSTIRRVSASITYVTVIVLFAWKAKYSFQWGDLFNNNNTQNVALLRFQRQLTSLWNEWMKLPPLNGFIRNVSQVSLRITISSRTFIGLKLFQSASAQSHLICIFIVGSPVFVDVFPGILQLKSTRFDSKDKIFSMLKVTSLHVPLHHQPNNSKGDNVFDSTLEYHSYSAAINANRPFGNSFQVTLLI